MQKLMKNWIFTLIVCILLSILTVLAFLDSFGVGDLGLIQSILNILIAVVLTLYLIFALFPLLKRYRGTVQAFLIFEIAILLVAIVAQACEHFFRIPILAEMQVCSVIGLALWLRGVVETIHAYVLNATPHAKKIPLWQLCCYILVMSIGVWQMVNPLIKDRYFGFCIAAAALVTAAIFAYATAQNRRALPPKPKKKKQKSAPADDKSTAVVPAEPEKAKTK